MTFRQTHLLGIETLQTGEISTLLDVADLELGRRAP